MNSISCDVECHYFKNFNLNLNLVFLQMKKEYFIPSTGWLKKLVAIVTQGPDF